MDFFAAKYDRENPRTDTNFGIVDRDDDPFARTTTDAADNPWDVKVRNSSSTPLHFIPVDKNIVVMQNGNMVSMCDGLLRKLDNSYLAFVEIKNRRKSDFTHASNQLASTIDLFKANHDVKNFTNRFAFVADHRRPSFQFSHKVEMNEFHSRHGFRLMYQGEIEVK